jgi:hypothetical protein
LKVPKYRFFFPWNKAEAKKATDQYIGNKLGISSPKKEPNLFEAYKVEKGKGRALG